MILIENRIINQLMEKVIRKIRNLREKEGYSQEYVAHHLGISQAAYSKLEVGESRLTLDKIEQIAKLYSMSIIELLALDEKIVIQQVYQNHNGVVFNQNDSGIEQRIKNLEEKLELVLKIVLQEKESK